MNKLKNCKTPCDYVTICHYFTTSKFLSMLVNKKLFFARGDMFIKDEWDGLPPDYKDFFYKYEYQRDYFYISCWTLNNKLSSKLWKEYASEDEGIAIKTKVRNIKIQLKLKEGDNLVFCKEQYDQEKQKAENFSTLIDPLLHKKKKFKFEKEARIILWPRDFVTVPESKMNNSIKKFDNESNEFFLHRILSCRQFMVQNSPKIGKEVEISNLEEMIESIHFAPKAGNWYKKMIRDILEKYDCKKLIDKIID